MLRRISYLGIQQSEGWSFRLYAIHHQERPDCVPHIPPLIREFEFSQEYSDFKFGFAVAHFGRRGDNVMFFRIGAWSDTVEIFNQSFYRLKTERVFKKSTVMDPIVCVHDIPITAYELALIAQAAAMSPDIDKFREIYFRMPFLSTSDRTYGESVV